MIGYKIRPNFDIVNNPNFKSILANHIGDDVIPVSERALKKPL